MFHEGQFEGRKVRLPVFLGRRPNETVDEDLQAFYTRLLKSVDQQVFREGQWSLCERSGWPDNASFQNLAAWNWLKDNERRLIVVNLSDCPSQARVRIPWTDTSGGKWFLVDAFSGATFERDGDDMASCGLYVELGPWNYHFFQCVRANNKK